MSLISCYKANFLTISSNLLYEKLSKKYPRASLNTFDSITTNPSMLFPSSILIHPLIIPLIITGGNVVHPFLVLEVPTDCLLDSFLELKRRFPAQLLLKFGAIDSITGIVTKTVGYISNQLF